MTRQELYDLWGRYMRRMDLGGDYDAVYVMVAQMISERLISITAPDIDAMLATSPRPLVHGGLLYLHELAQDNDGLMREHERFETALQDYGIRTSIDNVAPMMTRPYYPEAE